jgi:hypothetical protein
MDYAKIIENLNTESIIHLMTELGADRYSETDDYILFPTICHNIDASEASMKLYYYKNNKIFVCYTSCGSMSIFKFLRHYYEERQIEYDWYQDIYEVVCDCSSFKQKEGFTRAAYKSLRDRYGVARKEVQLPEFSSSVLGCFVNYYAPEWLDDGITKEAMETFDISYSISQNKIIIPHYDIDGRLVGIRGRALNDWEVENIGKYAPIRVENVWYKHPLSMNLYGLNITKKNIRAHSICFLFESEKSVMQAESFKLPNCSVAVCGSNFNKYQLNILMKTCAPHEIVLCFDKEELPGEDRYFNKLWNICQKYKNYCNFSFIYDREGLLDLKDSPTDKGEETFIKLLGKRVIVK